MCTIERFDRVYPDGRRVPSQRLRICARGTPSRPCSNVQTIQSFDDQYAVADELNPPTTPEYSIARSRRSKGSSSRPSSSREDPKPLTLSFKFWNPFKSKKSKEKLFLVRRKERAQSNLPAPISYYPRAPTPPPRPSVAAMPTRGGSPDIVNISPQRKSHSPSPPPRQRRPKRKEKCPKQTVVIEQSSSSGEESTTPSPVAARDHQRKSRSLSPRSRYEAEKRHIKEKERRRYAERVAKEEEQARKRAAKVAELERLERKKSEQERIEYEERKRLESKERARKRQEQEKEHKDLRSAQAKRKQELEDLEAIKAADRKSNRAAQREAQYQDEQARRQREERDRQRAEEAERIARARRANVPREPRHQAAVHYPQRSMEDRGERFIQEAIRQDEELRRRDSWRYHRRRDGN